MQGYKEPIYYTSKLLRDVETWYSKIEKMIYALITLARWLQSYFQAQYVVILIDQSLKSVLQWLDTSRWIAKWTIELSKFDVHYRSWSSSKAQVLADFIVKCSIPDKEPILKGSKNIGKDSC